MDDERPPDDSIVPPIQRAIEGTKGPAKSLDTESEWQAMSIRIAAERTRRLGPAGRRAALMRARRAPPAQIGVWATLACVILLLASVFHPPHRGQSAWREYATAPGQRATVTLSDGTKFTLAPASQLRVPVGYASGNRGVILDGEAFFTVAHDAEHRFSAQTSRAVITDIGTAFDVRAYASDHDVHIAVADGSVVVGTRIAAARGTLLQKGDMAVITDTTITVTHDADVNAATAWMCSIPCAAPPAPRR
jgi:ferric-dicitrate binding protein FerR (iron transport regulator)